MAASAFSLVDTRCRFSVYKTPIRRRRCRIDVLKTLKRRLFIVQFINLLYENPPSTVNLSFNPLFPILPCNTF